MFHLIEKLTSVSFKAQMYLLSSVELLRFSFLKELVWFKYLVLNDVSVRPTYVSRPLSSSLVTVA